MVRTSLQGHCVHALRCSAAGMAALLWQEGQYDLCSFLVRDMLHLVIVLAGSGHLLDPTGRI